jgi:LAO/AO transport system kinase
MEPAELRRIARAISTVENQADGHEELLKQAYRRPHWAQVIGITGAPGSGKSTLVDALTAQWAASGKRIALLAVDPSSPYSGGAVLGDRIRRARSTGFDNVYFRSLSSRGHVGGLSETTTDLVAVLGLFEFRRVIIETVGAGQADVEVHETADCTVVMTVPGLGDGVQAAKAGLMEIADIFAINKADMPGADDAARTIERALAAAYMGQPGINTPHHQAHHARTSPGAAPAAAPASAGLAALRRRHGHFGEDETTWVPPVLKLVATAGTGVTELAQAIDDFLDWSERTGRRRARRRERAYGQVVRALSGLLLAPYMRAPGSQELPAMLAEAVERVTDGNASPLEVARAVLRGQ